MFVIDGRGWYDKGVSSTPPTDTLVIAVIAFIVYVLSTEQWSIKPAAVPSASPYFSLKQPQNA